MENCNLTQLIKRSFMMSLLAVMTVSGLPAVAQLTATDVTTAAEATEGTEPQIEFVDLSGNGTPMNGQRRGMGSRSCSLEGIYAVIPESNLALVSRETPSLWFYMPYEADELQSLALRLWDKSVGAYVYENQQISLPQSPGFMGITLPEGQTLLTEGQFYNWELTADFECISEETGAVTSGSDFLDGVIQRVAGQDTGYDAIARSGMQRCVGGSAPEWLWLLKLIGYEEIAAEPVVACLTPGIVQAATE